MKNIKWDIEKIPSQKGKVVLITGATSGVGKKAAFIFVEKGAKVIIAARNVKKAEDTLIEIKKMFPEADILFRFVDLLSLNSILNFTNIIKHENERLDILINNAGVMLCPYSKTEDGFEEHMATNHFGHFALTLRLIELLNLTKDSRIVVVSSVTYKRGGIDFNDIHWEKRRYKAARAYADSKLANIYFARELARQLERANKYPLVTLAHPGWTYSELLRHTFVPDIVNFCFAQKVEMGVLPILRAACDEKVKSGDYFGPSGLFEMRGYPVLLPLSKRGEDFKSANKLWKISEDMTNVQLP